MAQNLAAGIPVASGEEVFLVFGAGAMGSLFGARLAEHYPTYMVGRRPHVEAVRGKGLTLSGESQGTFRPRAAVNVDELADQLREDGRTITHCLIFTKAYDTKSAIKELGRRSDVIGEGTVLISLQNGFDNEARLRKAMSSNPIVGGYCCHGAIHEGPGRVVHTGKGATVIGPYNEITLGKVEDVSRCLGKAGFPNAVRENISEEIMKKVLINACINSLTAILDVPNGKLLEMEWTRELMRRIVSEGCIVADQMGMDICPVPVLKMVEDVAKRTCANLSSMLQDVRKGDRTEIDSINGAIVRLAREHGMEAPVNETLALLIKSKIGEE